MTPFLVELERRADSRLDDDFARTLRKALASHQARELARSRRFARGLVVALFASLGLNWVQLALYVWK